MSSANITNDAFKRLAEIQGRLRDLLSHRPQMMWVALIALSGLFALIWDNHSAVGPTASVATREAPAQLDNMIPAGFVLVPIQISNFESLDSILGPYGIVDLFVPSLTPGARARKAASRVKILRAPQNPSQFAVLVEASASENLLAQGGSFFAVIQNTKETGTGIVMSDDKPRRMARVSRLIMEAPSK